MIPLFHLNEDILSHEKIIIYGAGVVGKGILLRLLQLDVKVDCFADSDPEKCGTRYLNIPIVHIDELDADKSSAAVIVCGWGTCGVAEQLKKRGFLHLYFDYGSEAGFIHLDRGQ